MPVQEGPHYRFEKYEWWAERGMISLIDTEAAADSATADDPDQFHWRIAPGTFLKRAVAALMHDPELYASQGAKLKKMLEEAAAACKLAKAQGDPTDPSVLADVVRHQRKCSIVMPGELPPMPGMAPPKLKIQNHGRSAGAILEKGVDVVPDITIDRSAMLTPQRAEQLRGKPARR
jgi:hypothetical protein